MRPPLARRALAEGCGTAFLVAVVVGSGIAAQRLSPGDVGLQLLENALATAGGLAVLILALGPVSGGHFNPVVSVVDAVLGGLRTRDLAAYVGAQVVGAVLGAVVANLMFDLGPVTWSTTSRGTAGVWLAEVVATAGLLVVVFGIVRSGRSTVVPFAVAAYIGSAYFFTSSTSFANPAVTVGRAVTDTFAGIAPTSVPAFVVAQAVGGILGLVLVGALYPTAPTGQRRERRAPRTASRGRAVPGAAPVGHHLAQLNIARLQAPLDSPELADFVAALEPVNALADAAPGFVWRLQTADGDATAIRVFDDDMLIVNMSVWTSIEALRDFVTSGGHRDVLRRRHEWFERMAEPHLVLWWMPAGHEPTIEEASDRLTLLRVQGPGPEAFTFRSPFPPPS